MRNRFYWGIGVLFILLIIGATVFVLVKDRSEMRQLEKELEALQKWKEDRETPEVSKEEHPAHGHFHEDGTFHVGEDNDEPEVKYTVPPGAVLEPVFPKIDSKEDPVEAAYKRLEYIKNNPYAWGGVHSECATELIAQLMPVSYPTDHDEGEERELLIDELCKQNDPRAAEVLIAIMCDGGMMGQIMFDTLEEIGPPAVPYILPYLEREDTMGSAKIYIGLPVFDSLSRIGTRYRDDLGGILDHIIIPKFKEIAADEDYKRYNTPVVIYAREALAKLQKSIKE